MTPDLRDHLQRRIVIAHRGASGYRPEHTLEAYRLAIRQGADFIEPDLVATADGVLVARHENEISATTDVAGHPEFAGRRTTKRVDGVARTGWFTEDFTLAELKTLRARERIPGVRPANAHYDGEFEIPTFAEVVRLAAAESRDGRVVGVYPETKTPTYFLHEGRRLDGSRIGIDLGRALVETLVAEGFTDPRRVYIQSFEVANLLALKQAVLPAAGIDLPLVQLFGRLGSTGPYDVRFHAAQGADLRAIYDGLVDAVGGMDVGMPHAALASAEALRWMRGHYASAIGPWKGDVLRHDAGLAAHAGAMPAFVSHALQAGLAVHPYTLRAEDAATARPTGGDPPVVAEALRLYRLGVQGFFIDQPDLGVLARERFLEG